MNMINNIRGCMFLNVLRAKFSSNDASAAKFANLLGVQSAQRMAGNPPGEIGKSAINATDLISSHGSLRCRSRLSLEIRPSN